MTSSPPVGPTFPDPPVLTPTPATAPPELPATWRAVALLTPWQDAQLLVALVDTDSVHGLMRVRLVGLEHGRVDLLFTQDGAYVVEAGIGSDAAARMSGPILTTAVVPPTGWLATAGLRCAGIGEVLGTPSAWWIGETTGQNSYVNWPPAPMPAQVGNYFNFRADTGMPWRLVFVNPTNDYRLPVLGAYPIVHLPTFDAVAADSQDQTELQRLGQAVSSATPADDTIDVDTAAGLERLLRHSAQRMSDAEVAAGRELVRTLIPGLAPAPADGTLPYWQDRLFLTSFSTPTGQTPGAPPPVPIPTQVFYDWPKQRMLTRMWVAPDTFEDAILDASSTHVVLRLPDGTHRCVKTLPVGLVKPRWASQDTGARCRATITDNPQLSPDGTTNVCVLPSRPGQVFWTWYRDDDRPVMFVEVPQACDVMLLLTDYADWDPAPAEFDPSLFVVPADCAGGGVGAVGIGGAASTSTGAPTSTPTGASAPRLVHHA